MSNALLKNDQALELAEAFQVLPKMLTLIPVLELQIRELTEEVLKLKNSNSTGWVTIQDGAKAVGLTVGALRQTIMRENLPENRVWKQHGKGTRVYVHVEELKEAI